MWQCQAVSRGWCVVCVRLLIGLVCSVSVTYRHLSPLLRRRAMFIDWLKVAGYFATLSACSVLLVAQMNVCAILSAIMYNCCAVNIKIIICGCICTLCCEIVIAIPR